MRQESASGHAFRALLVAAALLVGSRAEADNFTFLVEPSYPVDQAEEVYKPLIDYLNRTTGHSFKLVVPRNYHFHWRDLRQNAAVDFTYEEAHFIDYRAKRFGFEPLVKKSTPSVYVVLADEQYAANGLAGLVGRRIVSMPSPSLGFAMLAEMYTNPVSQPDFRSEASSWRDGVEMVFSGDAEAAMVPDFIASQYPNLVELRKSRAFPGTAVSAGPNVSAEVKQAVRDAMLALHEDPDAYNTLSELGAVQYEAAKASDFNGYDKMLSGFFGYKEAGVE